VSECFQSSDEVWKGIDSLFKFMVDTAACALEAFLDSLLNHGVELASNRGAKLLNSAHM